MVRYIVVYLIRYLNSTFKRGLGQIQHKIQAKSWRTYTRLYRWRIDYFCFSSIDKRVSQFCSQDLRI